MPVLRRALRASGFAVIPTIAISVLAAPSSAQESGGAGLDEVIVTAQRYEQNLQDVPISVSAFSGEQIEARSTDGLKEFAGFVPNLTFSNAGASGESGNIIYIRGVGNNDSGIEFSPGVGVYIDGVYVGVMRGLDLGLIDVERMEVLRGPQGTLFGRNTTGGAINVISRRPEDRFEGRASLTGGSFSRLDGKLSVNVPLVAEKLAARIAVASRNRDGFGKHVDFNTGERIGESGDVDSLAGRAALEFTPTQQLSFLLSVDATRSRAHLPPYTLVATCPGACTAVPTNINNINAANDPDWGTLFIPTDPFSSYATGPNTNDLDSFGAGLIATWNLSDQWTLKSLTSHREADTLYEVDVDTGPYALLHSWQITDQQQFSQELLLSGSTVDDRLETVLGAFFYEDDTFSDRPSRSGQAVALPPAFRTTAWQGGNNRSWAVYGQSTFDVTSRLSLTGGARYTQDEVEGRGPASSGTVVDWDAVTGRAGVQYAWSDGLMTYLSAARGYKSGGLNTNASTLAAFVPFDPEKIWTYEAGFKSDLLDRRLRLNIAIFHSDYEDLQFRQRVFSAALNQFVSVTDNAAKAKIDGLEAELSTVPMAGLTLNLSIGYTDARYTEIEPGAPITTANEFIETPKWNGAVGGEYELAVGSGSLITRLDYSYRSATEHDLANSPRLRQPAYGLVNARLTYEAKTWSVSVFGTNLTDEHYFLNGIDFVNNLGFASVQYARPREWGVSVTKEF